LEGLLRSPAADERYAAATALERLEAAAEPAAAGLRAALGDTDEEVRAAARSALDAIERSKKGG
jgi:HEAT repeat protein